MTYTDVSSILSHPESQTEDSKTLLTHLEGVKQNALQLQPLNTSKKINHSEELVSDIAYLHDIGKATQHFQRYIRDEDYNHSLKQHSEIGAVIASHVLGQKYDSEYIQIATFIIIKNHHGYLQRNLDSELKNHIKTNPSATEVRERLKTQLHDMEPAKELINKILENCDSTKEYDDLLEEEIYQKPAEYKKLRDWTKTNNLYEDVLSLWSTLITADKLDAASLSNSYFNTSRKTIDYNNLESYISQLQSRKLDTQLSNPVISNKLSQLNQLRETARQTAIDWAENQPVTEQPQTEIYNLSLPTGFGKTYTGLSAAFRLSEKKDGNIIYALPFTSIIDQVDDEIQTIFEVTPTDPEYTIHHYLAETRTTIHNKRDTDIDSRKEFMLAKSWNSHLTLTTFVQLFESLTAPKNTQSLKIPSLKNSVIILDEPQALSYDWWHLIPKLAQFLNQKYNATIISMTATQPLLFKNSSAIDSVTEILPNKSQYYAHLKENNRVTYQQTEQLNEYLRTGSEAEPDQYTTIAKQITNDFTKRNSVCAICNTVKSTRTLTEKLESIIDEINFVNTKILTDEEKTPADAINKNKVNLIHLSTRITPFDRRRLLKSIQHASETNAKLCVISTQLIEAGVDISFEKLYRDLAPIPSIIQAGGRCNRNNEVDVGEIIITRLGPTEDDRETTPSALIYNSSLPLIDATRKTLSPNEIYQEGNFIQLTNTFYQKLTNAGDTSYIDYIKEYNVEKLDTLSLINSYETIDVSITETNRKQELFGTESFKNLSIKRQQYISTELEEHTTSIPLPTQESEKQQIRNQLAFKFAEQYFLHRASDTYSKKYGLKITEQPDQFI